MRARTMRSSGRFRPKTRAFPSSLVAELRQDGFVGLLVRHEDLFPFGKVFGVPLSWEAVIWACSRLIRRRPSERLVEARLVSTFLFMTLAMWGRLVTVSHPRPCARGGDQALLMLYAVHISPPCPCSEREERLGTVKRLQPILYAVLLAGSRPPRLSPPRPWR